MNHQRDLMNKTIVVTGATSGIGREAARALALRGAHVIGVGRSASRCEDVKRALRDEWPGVRIDFAVADLSSQRQIHQLAAKIYALAGQHGEAKVDVLINNAGTVSSWYTTTEDGYETQFAVNHLAPFLLTNLLMPLLEKAPAARVITVSSGSHYRTRMNWDDVMLRQRYGCLTAYKQSKLANVLFTAELNRRLHGAGISAFAADPGLVNTEIGLKRTSGIENLVWKVRRTGGVTPREGAETVIFLASDPGVKPSHGIYWKDCQPVAPSEYAQQPEQATRLWSLSERLCGVS